MKTRIAISIVACWLVSACSTQVQLPPSPVQIGATECPYYGKEVFLPSWTYARKNLPKDGDFPDIINNRPRVPQTISAIFLKSQTPGRLPALVMMQDSGGRLDRQHTWANYYRNAGFTVLMIDSFEPRNVKNTIHDDSVLTKATTLADAFAGLNYLASLKCIDSDRISIIGYSRGGNTAAAAAHEPLAEKLAAPGLRFASNIAVYPGCNAIIASPKPRSGQRIFFQMGELDDYTPAVRCQPLIERFRTAGANVSAKIYEGAHHGWDIDDQRLRFISNAQTSACASEITDSGVLLNMGSRTEDCSLYGAHVQGRRSIAEESVKDAIEFLKSVGPTS